MDAPRLRPAVPGGIVVNFVAGPAGIAVGPPPERRCSACGQMRPLSALEAVKGDSVADDPAMVCIDIRVCVWK